MKYDCKPANVQGIGRMGECKISDYRDCKIKRERMRKGDREEKGYRGTGHEVNFIYATGTCVFPASRFV